MHRVLSSVFQYTCHYRPVGIRFNSTVSQNLVNEDLAKRLETVSLVGFSKHHGFEVLSSSVKFADRIIYIDTTKVQPLITVLENWYVTTIIREINYTV